MANDVKNRAESLYTTLLEAGKYFSKTTFKLALLNEQAKRSEYRKHLVDLEENLWRLTRDLDALIATTQELIKTAETTIEKLKQ